MKGLQREVSDCSNRSRIEEVESLQSGIDGEVHKAVEGTLFFLFYKAHQSGNIFSSRTFCDC